MNVVATCTNVTYYACNHNNNQSYTNTHTDTNTHINEQTSEPTVTNNNENINESLKITNLLQLIGIELLKCLFNENTEIILESLRAIGSCVTLRTVLFVCSAVCLFFICLFV